MNDKKILLPAILAFILSVAVAVRVVVENTQFTRTVRKSEQTTRGYDQRFINMVKRLESVLAQRASFGYPGGRDPMTGKHRFVAKRSSAKVSSKKSTGASARTKAKDFKLTATFSDDNTGKYTAIIMYKERSFSAEVGDIIANRKIRKITPQNIVMESNTHLYFYDIEGNVKVKKK